MNKFAILLYALFVFVSLNCFALENDFLVEETLENVVVEKPKVNTHYNYESCEKVPVKLQIKTPISTKNEAISEGQIIDFIIKEDVKHNYKTIVPKGTVVSAEVQTYMSRGMNGIPAVLILDDFEIKNIEKAKLKGTYIKKGQNRSLLVLPIKWALTPIPFVGSTTNMILGGHAKIKKKNTIEIYYFPEWNEK